MAEIIVHFLSFFRLVKSERTSKPITHVKGRTKIAKILDRIKNITQAKIGLTN